MAFNRFALLLCSMILFFMSSCVRYHRQDPSVKPRKRAPVTKSVDQAASSTSFQFGKWPEKKWWKMFDDEKLSELVEEALHCNPLLKSSRARVDVARELALMTRSKLFPSVGGDADLLYIHLSKNSLIKTIAPTAPTNIHPTFVLLDFSYEFDFWGKNWNAFQAALGEARAQDAANAQAKLIVGINVATEYYTYQSLLHKRRLIENAVEIYRELLSLVEMQQLFRMQSALDVLDAKNDLLKATNALTGIDEEIKRSQHQLGVLLGKSPDFEAEILEHWQPFHDLLQIPDDIELELVARRPDLMAQIWRVDAAARKIKSAKAEFYPNVSLYGLGGYESVKFSELFSAKSLMATVLPAIHLPLFTGGRLRANLGAKRQEFEVLVNEYNAQVLSAAKEVADRLVELESLALQLARQKERVNNTRIEENLIKLRFHERMDSKLSSLHAALKLIDAQVCHLEMQTWRYYAALGFIKSIGGGYEPKMRVECH